MNKGYIAITSVLIIAAVSVVAGLVIALASISEGQTSLSSQRREEAINFIESCIEDSLYSINTKNILNSTDTIPTGTCSVVTNSHVGNVWTFTVSGTLNGFYKSIQVTATRTSTIGSITWKEQ